MTAIRLERLQQLGPRGVACCVACKVVYGALQPIFRYDWWHASSPYCCREYKRRTVELASTVDAEVAVDLGCGFGEIITRVKARRRYGIDRSPEAIRFARFINGRKAKFIEGSITDPAGIGANLKEPRIDLLIITGWLHGVPFARVQTWLTELREVMPVGRLLIDTVHTIHDGYAHTAEDLSRLGQVEISIPGGGGRRDLHLIRIE